MFKVIAIIAMLTASTLAIPLELEKRQNCGSDASFALTDTTGRTFQQSIKTGIKLPFTSIDGSYKIKN